ncbi:UNVERIFIED_CONTAM: hypothetical protein Scaly_1226000 [Sesamum calycinum]|uniref:IST1-like protein n=2 Tax=Sesamum TaxID=4181 RepID=A0AAW2Q561_9LAMI
MGLNKMFGRILGLMGRSSRRWRKASTCEGLIKKLKIRLANQKSRKNVIIRQSRDDIAQLLRINHQQYHAALARVEQLYKDECKLSAYEQLDGFCDCVHNNLCYISRHSSKLSVEVLEALSSLIFGASRCGELPELHSLRNLFRQQFGHKFERMNVEMLPGNAVNSRLAHSLDTASVTQDVKLKLLQEIQNEYTIHSVVSPSQEQTNFIPEIKKQKGNLYHQSDHDDQHASRFEDMMKIIRRCLCFLNYAINSGGHDGSLCSCGQAQGCHRNGKGISTCPTTRYVQ